MVEAIVPSSSGNDGLHPKPEITLFADLADEPVLPRSCVAVDDVDLRLLELVRGVLRGGLELGEESYSGRIFEELLGVVEAELAEWSLAEESCELDEISTGSSLSSSSFSWSLSNELGRTAVTRLLLGFGFAAIVPRFSGVEGALPVTLVCLESNKSCELAVRASLLGFDVDLDVMFTSRGGDFVGP